MTNEDKFYSRQINLIGTLGQKKIKDTSVLVVGAGGLGCPVLLYLGAMGVGRIGIIDQDKVDITNLHRQVLYAPKDVGLNKADIAASKIIEQNPFTEIEFYTEKLTSKNIIQIFSQYEIIVDCTDNFQTKFLVHDTCYHAKKKLIQASIYQYEGNLHVFDFTKSDECSPCLRCLWTKEPEDGCVGTCADVGVLGATAGVLGTLQAMEVSKLILGNNPLSNGEGLFVDLITHDYEKRRFKKNKDCSLCGHGAKKETSDYKLEIDQLTDDLVWIDIRSADEVSNYKIDHEKLIHMPLEDFNISLLNPDHQYLLICQRGYRSNQAARALRESGHSNFFSLVHGLENFWPRIS